MRSISSFLSTFLSSLKDEDTCLIVLAELWPQIVGPEVAPHSQPHRLRRGRLVLAVSNNLWRAELSSMEPLLIQAVNQFWARNLVKAIELGSSQD